jgi:hypothetical protein
MIGNTDLPDWGTLFIGALVALAITICSQALFWRPPKKRISTPKQPLTLRIDEIPIDTSIAALTRDLHSVVYQHLGLKEDAITIKLHSLFRRDQRTACATATFGTSLPKTELIKKLQQAETNLPHRFDNRFHGITPLYEAREGAEVE